MGRTYSWWLGCFTFDERLPIIWSNRSLFPCPPFLSAASVTIATAKVCECLLFSAHSLPFLPRFLPSSPETQHPLKKNAGIEGGGNECVDLDLSSLGEAGNGFSGGCGSCISLWMDSNRGRSEKVGEYGNPGKLSAILRPSFGLKLPHGPIGETFPRKKRENAQWNAQWMG